MEGYLRKFFINANSNLMVQFLRYIIVGGVAAFADISVFHIAANILRSNHIVANTLSFSLGLLINYFMSRSWVFNKQGGSFKKDFLLFAIIGVLGLLLSNLILYVLVDLKLLYNLFAAVTVFDNEEFIKLFAKLIAVFIVLFWNFIARKKIVFN